MNVLFVLTTVLAAACAAGIPSNFKVKPVAFELYYEALCPDCVEFVRSQLGDTWQKLAKTSKNTSTTYT